MRTKTHSGKLRKVKTNQNKNLKLAPKSEEVEAEYQDQRMYERWDAQHLAYSDIDLHY